MKLAADALHLPCAASQPGDRHPSALPARRAQRGPSRMKRPQPARLATRLLAGPPSGGPARGTRPPGRRAPSAGSASRARQPLLLLPPHAVPAPRAAAARSRRARQHAAGHGRRGRGRRAWQRAAHRSARQPARQPARRWGRLPGRALRRRGLRGRLVPQQAQHEARQLAVQRPRPACADCVSPNSGAAPVRERITAGTCLAQQ